jgi:hypothetical protein
MRMMRRFGSLAAAAALAGAQVAGFWAAAGSAETTASLTSFEFSGASQSLVVPAGVTQLDVDAFGAQGGAGGACLVSGVNICGAPGVGGLGAHVTSSVLVTPGETLTIVIGGHGADGQSLDQSGSMPCSGEFTAGGAGGFGGGADGGDGGCPAGAGGGGGGATAILRGSTPLVIAAGGGGASGSTASLSHGRIDGGNGGESGSLGLATPTPDVPCTGAGGGAGTAVAGGAGGGGGATCTFPFPTDAARSDQFTASAVCTVGAGAAGVDGDDGTAAAGGAGGEGGIDDQIRGGGAGGGGGGRFGGGGGGGGGANCFLIASAGGGGGGGSSLATTVVDGIRTGDGSLTITFTAPAAQAVNLAPRFTG